MGKLSNDGSEKKKKKNRCNITMVKNRKIGNFHLIFIIYIVKKTTSFSKPCGIIIE